MSSKKGYYVPNKKEQKTIRDSSSENQSIIYWALTIFSVFFLVWAPFQKALFNGNSFDFERPIYSTLIWACILLFLISVNMYFQTNFFTRSFLISALVWMIPLTFLFSSLHPASRYYANNMNLIEIAFCVFFLLGYSLSRTEKSLSILTNIVLTTGYIVVGFGVINWFGNKELAYNLVSWFAAEMKNINFYQDAIMADQNGVRLTSSFQYANAYAAFLIALLLGALYLVSTSKRWYSIAYHSFMIIPIYTSFWVTLSRGALVILPVIFLVCMLILKPNKQLTLLIHTIIATLISFIVLGPISNIGVEQVKSYNSALSLKGWGFLSASTIIFTFIVMIIQKYVVPIFNSKLVKINSFRFSNLYFPAGAILAGVLAITLLLSNNVILNLLPENIKQRVENINFQQNSVLERGTFYVDAIKLFQDYPITGAGGGAWSALYEKYQNNPYVSRQAHNFFLQYLVETGIVGMTVFLLLLAAVFWIFIRTHRQSIEESNDRRMVFYIIAVSLLIHSMIDFDLSYVYLGILLFLSLGAMISGDTTEFRSRWVDTINKYRWVYPSLLMVFSIVMFFQSTQLLSGNTHFKNAVALAQAQKPVSEIFASLDKAIVKNPGHPDYVGYKIDILLQLYNQTKEERYYTEALALIGQIRTTESHNRMLLEKEIYAYLMKNDLEKALTLVTSQIENFPWDISLYERSVTLNTSLGDKAQTENNAQKKDQYWNRAFETYYAVIEKQKVLTALPKEQQQGRAFNVTKAMGLNLGQIEYIRGKYSEAEKLLSIGMDTNVLDDMGNRLQVRWYLASLQKQGKNDQALLDKLVAKDANERSEIQNLVNAKF
ncbi:O-antigen ligase family protein [Paenibacillus sp. GD4]|uniref:O-antigen ligase family protein n=1 Tax=Paenibacillus sp. GD4 TaxID=3068890 RepID=UPI0027966F23|nr:O-antigen ligase family protein [Paenibacillus sp. GD4]MDQ1911628.1 O-antigen ligase family protein [Paenibacillus sp. GD4]